VFVETSGTNNTYLYLCLILCEGEVEEIGDIYIDDVLLDASSRHNSYVSIDKKLGTDAQTVSTILNEAPSWGSTDTLNGIAYLGVKLTYNQDVFNGIPTINAIVKGRKVYDPRSSTTVYSNNPALCLRDYLVNDRYGKGLPSSVIDDASFILAANDCDVDVDSYDGGPSVKAFSCNAVLLTNNSLFNNVKIILSGMQGIMPYQNGQYRLFVEKDKASTFDFTTDMIIGGISITGSNKSSKYNKITAKFINPDANWQADSVVWPEADSAEASSFLTEDSNVELSSELNLTTVSNYYQARNIAKTAVLASRLAGLRVSFLATSEALNCAVGDIVTVTHPTPGWNQKEFRLTRLSLNYDGTVSVLMVEHIAAIYPWVKDKVQPVSAQSTLPNPFTVGEVTDIRFNMNTSYTEQYGSIEWECDDAFVNSYKVIVDGESAKFDASSSNDDYGVSFQAYAKSVSVANNQTT
ncbi:phage tail protein, partial [Shewanella sp.]|uniref:phage tail protein n=1 Tax=Shewanella sp. TaxID=50422 RepID=UPI004048B68E